VSLVQLWPARRPALRERIAGADPATAARLLGDELRALGAAYAGSAGVSDAQRAGAAHGLAIAALAPAHLLNAARTHVTVQRPPADAAPRGLAPRPGLLLMTLAAAVLAAIMFTSANLPAGLALAFVALLGVLALAGSAWGAVAPRVASALMSPRAQWLPWWLRRLARLRRQPAPPGEPAPQYTTRVEVDVEACLAWLDDVVSAVDRMTAALRPPPPDSDDGRWPDTLLAAFRELVAASSAGDRDLAMLGAEQLRGALAVSGVVAVVHDGTHDDWFEPAPAGPGGPTTIRPALVRTGDPDHLLYRGIHAR
jgi:hypothetical protein